jgi:hypothetical protein
MITRNGSSYGDRTGIRVAEGGGGNLLPGICCRIQRHDCIIDPPLLPRGGTGLLTGIRDKKTRWR